MNEMQLQMKLGLYRTATLKEKIYVLEVFYYSTYMQLLLFSLLKLTSIILNSLHGRYLCKK
jgi:hypothetical protein